MAVCAFCGMLAPALIIAHVAGNAFAGEPPKPQASEPSRIPKPPETFPLTQFYDVPNPLPAGKPGDLIRSQPFDEYMLPVDVSAVRILYHSVSAAGEDVAASGVVLMPYGTPPREGWPVIAWAHPFIATSRLCAPSLMRRLHEAPVFSMYINLGYAVVATDYVGLGTSFRNAFTDGQSNATDVINSVIARARPCLNSAQNG